MASDCTAVVWKMQRCDGKCKRWRPSGGRWSVLLSWNGIVGARTLSSWCKLECIVIVKCHRVAATVSSRCKMEFIVIEERRRGSYNIIVMVQARTVSWKLYSCRAETAIAQQSWKVALLLSFSFSH